MRGRWERSRATNEVDGNSSLPAARRQEDGVEVNVKVIGVVRVAESSLLRYRDHQPSIELLWKTMFSITMADYVDLSKIIPGESRFQTSSEKYLVPIG
jgi:hypothetical protein